MGVRGHLPFPPWQKNYVSDLRSDEELATSVSKLVSPALRGDRDLDEAECQTLNEGWTPYCCSIGDDKWCQGAPCIGTNSCPTRLHVTQTIVSDLRSDEELATSVSKLVSPALRSDKKEQLKCKGWDP